MPERAKEAAVVHDSLISELYPRNTEIILFTYFKIQQRFYKLRNQAVKHIFFSVFSSS